MSEQLQELSINNDRTMFPKAKKQAPDAAFSATNDTRSHLVHTTDPSKTVNVSSSLTHA